LHFALEKTHKYQTITNHLWLPSFIINYFIDYYLIISVETSKHKIHPLKNQVHLKKPTLFKCYHPDPVLWLHNSCNYNHELAQTFGNILLIPSVLIVTLGIYTCVDRKDFEKGLDNSTIAEGELFIEGKFS